MSEAGLRKAPPDDARPLDHDMAEARARAILHGLDLGDWSVIIDPSAEELATVYADSMRDALELVGFVNGDETINEARENLGLPPIDNGDEPLSITNQVNELAVDWAKERSAALVTQINENTRDMLNATVVDAVEEGWSAQELANEIADSAGFSDARSMTIARTELLNANRQGSLRGYREAKIWGKEWITSGDDLVEDDCQENEDAGPIPLDEDFPNGDSPHPACRCAVAPVVDEPTDEEDNEE